MISMTGLGYWIGWALFIFAVYIVGVIVDDEL
jgi:hypothetical protein